jgi:hypothetical protein
MPCRNRCATSGRTLCRAECISKSVVQGGYAKKLCTTTAHNHRAQPCAQPRERGHTTVQEARRTTKRTTCLHNQANNQCITVVQKLLFLYNTVLCKSHERIHTATTKFEPPSRAETRKCPPFSTAHGFSPGLPSVHARCEAAKQAWQQKA